MQPFVNYVTLIIGFIIVYYSLKRIFLYQYSILHLCILVFFVMQVLPLLVDCFNDVSELQRYTTYLYYSMIDNDVSLIYCVFCVFTMLILYICGNSYANKTTEHVSFSLQIPKNKIVQNLSFICMFLPVVGVFLSPSPLIYLNFSYFYTHLYNDLGIDYLYHKSVILSLNFIASFAILVYYYYKSDSKTTSLYTYLAAIIVVWVDGKRALLLFLLLGILFIDFMRLNFKMNKRIIIKSLALTTFVFCYLSYYSNVTQKNKDDSAYLTYNAYLCREGEVKTAIYSRYYNKNMLPYDGATLLFNMTFFIPRIYWEDKPYGFYNYLTSFAYFGTGDNFLPRSNRQVNIWSEFIANLGILGYMLSFVFVCLVVRVSERSDNKILYMVGTLFILTYFCFGFEFIVRFLFIIWVVLLIKNNSKKHKRKVIVYL